METYKLNRGQILTFYSYKGGSGRSMALANVACLLAQKQIAGGEVLMIDWDLEAPGLHQFFHGRVNDSLENQEDLPKDQLGLIDFFIDVKAKMEDFEPYDDIPESFFDRLDFDKYIAKINIGESSLFLMPGGRFDDNLYSSRVNGFDWEEFFNSYPTFITQFAYFLRKRFKYVLIDSRTGYTDISGICTSVMPEKLIVVFTPNRQSLSGVIELVRRATDYRKQSSDLRQLFVFPLPSRIENAERDLQKDWRHGNSSNNIAGYQEQFESVLMDVYELQNCDLTDYFDEVQLQYIPKYSYGEEIAVLSERAEERLSLARSFEDFSEKLISNDPPWVESEDVGVKDEKKNYGTKSLSRSAARGRLTPRFIVSIIGLFLLVVLLSLSPMIGGFFSSLNPTGIPPSITLEPDFTATSPSTITSTTTNTSVLFPVGVYTTPGAIEYYFDPSLESTKLLGDWNDIFYICNSYTSSKYQSYEIAKSSDGCSSGNKLGWVSSDLVKISIGQIVEARNTFVPSGTKQCSDGIDNDTDGFIDYPSDPGCSDPNDDREDILETPTPLPVVTVGSRCRLGPGPDFLNVAVIPQGDNVEVVGRNDLNDWLWVTWTNEVTQITYECWIFGELVDFTVDPTVVPTVLTPTLLPPLPDNPADRFRVSAPGQVSCPSGDVCGVHASIRNVPSGNICVFVQPKEVPGQDYYFQFEGTNGTANIGPAPTNTSFVIIAVATSSSCPTGQQSKLPTGITSTGATVIRINQ